MLAEAIRREDLSKTAHHNLTKEASRKREENKTEVLRRDEADKKVQALNQSLAENLTVLVSAWLRQQETAGQAGPRGPSGPSVREWEPFVSAARDRLGRGRGLALCTLERAAPSRGQGRAGEHGAGLGLPAAAVQLCSRAVASTKVGSFESFLENYVISISDKESYSFCEESKSRSGLLGSIEA